jgi:subtilisin family serine protease
VVVVSSDNEAKTGDTVNAYAAFPGVLDVAGVDSNGQKYSEGHYGPDVDVAAPANSIEVGLVNGQYGTNSGTSFAAPWVSGEAALLIAKHPTWTSGQIVATIIDNTMQVAGGQAKAGQRVDNNVGYGVIDPLAALGASEPSSTANPLGGPAVTSSPGGGSASATSGSGATSGAGTATPTGTKTASKSSSSTPLIIGIVVAAVVVIGLLIFFLSRGNRNRGGKGGPGAGGGGGSGGGGGGNAQYMPQTPPGGQYGQAPQYQQPNPYPQQGSPYPQQPNPQQPNPQQGNPYPQAPQSPQQPLYPYPQQPQQPQQGGYPPQNPYPGR